MADKKKSEKKPETDPKSDLADNDQSKAPLDPETPGDAGANIPADTKAVVEGDVQPPDAPSSEDARADDAMDTDAPKDEPDIADTEIVTSEPIDADLSDQENDPASDQIAPDPEPKPDPSSPATVEVVERIVEKRGGFLPALIGGIVAAILGFLAASSNVVAPYLPASMQRPDASEDIAALQAADAETTAAIAGLRDQIAAAQDVEPVDLSGIESRISEIASDLQPLSGRIDSLDGRLGDLDTRLTELEKRPVTEGVAPEAIAAYERELEALQSAVSQQRSEIEAMLNEAREMDASASQAARIASARAALAQLRSAIGSGTPFAASAEELQELGVDLPGPLATVAPEGVVALSTLRNRFPDAARAALSAARAESSEEDGVAGFLRRQLGARSVAPREGDDPDAVLSRAEAALEAGDLAAALSEIEMLPESARSALSDWTDAARARLDATAAADALSQRLNES